ncbi:MAG: SET domain-containing protein-lysine N-methyltransferase [Candidatus Acidiferrales bacterium]|jgi:SET domain-containing protein
MPTKQHRPRLDSNLVCFRLRIRRSRIERLGVFTEETIPPRKRVIQYTGERISKREVARRTARMFLAEKAGRVYMVRVNGRSTLDGAVGGSGAEFINHSCDPNLSMRRIRGQMFLYSFRKIRAGEELTVDYGFRCSCPCRCGSSNCRGTMCQPTRSTRRRVRNG